MRKSKYCICVILGLLVVCMLSACTSTEEIDEYIEEDVEENIYAVIKSEYEKVDFSGNFELGENVFHEEYLKLLQCNVPFVVPETGEEIYLNQLGQLDSFMLDSYDLEALEYYYYDIDGDRISELGVTDGVNFICLFDYDVQNGQMVLWQDLCSTWYRVMGTGKVFWNNGGNDIVFYELDEQGNEKLSVYFYSEEFYNREKDTAEIRYMVALPQYSDENEQRNISQHAAYYDEGQQLCYFSVTKEEFEELTEEYFKAEQESKQNIKEVSHTYQEILRLLSENEYSFQMEKQVYSLNPDQDVNADIEISYPQLTGYVDEKKQESINKLILADLEKVVEAGLDDIGEELALELEYEVKLINENMISIFYHGVYGEVGYKNGFEPIAICTNIDLTKGKIISLDEVVADFDELRRLLLSDVFENISVWDGIKGTDKISREYSGNKEKLLTNLQNDRFDFSNHYIEWYITDDSFVVVSLYSSVYQEYSQCISNLEGIFSDYFYGLQNVGTDRISWTVLNEKDTEKTYSYEIERAFELAQENRIQEVAASLSKSIGKWSVKELILPMAIGQDSTRSQLGMELSQTDIEIFKDFSVQLGEERYTVHDIAIRDYEWYLDRLRQGPYFAEGLIVELYYVNEEDKRFSICLAENEMYLFSYACGFYNVVSQVTDPNVMPEELEGNVLDMLKEAYRKRYGDIESQLESMCGTWIGEKYSFSDELVKLVGKYDMELQYRNEKFVIVFEGEIIETKLVEVFSTGSYTEEQCIELLEVPSQIQSYLKLYSEGYILHLKQKENDIFVAVSKGDLELEEQERKMKILINGELYNFIR